MFLGMRPAPHVGAVCHTAHREHRRWTPRRPSITRVDDVVARLTAVPGARTGCATSRSSRPRPAVSAPWPDWVQPRRASAFERAGVSAPWQHQAAAADAAHAGQHVVLSTGTASGKSLAYQLPALTAIRDVDVARRGERGAGVLYLAPTKALAQDQLANIAALGLDVRVTTHDGDSTREQRDWARDYGEYVLTNPDMLHRSLLPRHARWSAFLGSLRYVVVDECHHYRGVFGAHVAHMLRRLRRICAMYGAHPTFVLASATVAEPEVAAGRLTGLDVLAVTDRPLAARPGVAAAVGAAVHVATPARTAHRCAGPRRPRPPTCSPTWSPRTSARWPSSARGEAPSRSRRPPPSCWPRSTRRCRARVAAYRGGYLPEERRELEAALRRGDLTGLAATNALELGIDISGLDAVLIAGFPGTRAALWQQIGRAGRGAQDALGVLVARDDPLDTYLVNHPEALLGKPVEATVFDPSNPYVLGPHLCAAAQEQPLTEADLPLFGPNARQVVDQLTEAGLLRRRPSGWFWTDRRRASDLADIRSSGGAPVQLVESETGRVIGTVDGSSSHGTAHAGAVYVHRGETWLVESLDLEEHVAVMHRGRPALLDLGPRDHRHLDRRRARAPRLGGLPPLARRGRRVAPGGLVPEAAPAERRGDRRGAARPARAVAANDRGVVDGARRRAHRELALAAADLPGAAHAAEHCSIGLLPLFATCDRWDIGGVSTALHADTGRLTVFVYDGHPGGAGFAERGFHAACDWLTATRETIASCECETGCPSCIQSPKCGNQNNPLDKGGAVALLDLLLAGARAE